MQYHVYQHKRTLKSGPVRRWYHYHYDGSGKKIQLACKGCRTREEAEEYVRRIQPHEPPPPPAAPPQAQFPVSRIAESMFLPGSQHTARRRQLGKSTNPDTMRECRHYAALISSLWGDSDIRDLQATSVMQYLFDSPRSGKWKNRFIEVLGEVYSEAKWHGASPARLELPKFAPMCKKADIFTPPELAALLQPGNFQAEEMYLLFLTAFSAGMRLGEARAVQARQLIPDRQILVIDGFCKKDGSRTRFNKRGTPDEPKSRIVCIPSQTAALLQRRISSLGLGPGDWMFPRGGKPIRQELAGDEFHRALQKIGLMPPRQKAPRNQRGDGKKRQARQRRVSGDGRKLVPHSLRYTYVSMMRQHITSHELRPMTGHSSDAMVDYYNRTVLDMTISLLAPTLRSAAESIASWMS